MPQSSPLLSPPPAIDSLPPTKGERVAKLLARAGVCSRRDGERFILAGRVTVDGQAFGDPSRLVGEHAQIAVDGVPIAAPSAARLWRYHKPNGLVTTHKDPQNRATVFQHLPPELPRVVSVGRLDLTAEGLLLLTNNGALARRLELPATGLIRRYRVRIHGTITQDALDRLANGVTIDGVHYGPVAAQLEPRLGDKSANCWVTMTITEGKNREIRKLVTSLGGTVTRLIRTAYGPFELGTLGVGAVEEVPAKLVTRALG